MTIGPEPMTRIRWMSARRGMNQVIDDVVTRPGGYPPGGVTKLCVVANQHGDVHWPRQRRIRSNVGSHTHSTQDGQRERAHADPFTAAHVVRLAGRAALDQGEVRLHDVTHV